jgi:hypothetical protein
MFFAREDGFRFAIWEDERCVALLEANDEAGFRRFLAALESNPSGHWQLAGSAAANGVRWPAFDELFQQEHARYRGHPEAAVPLSEKPWRSQTERRDMLNRRTQIIAALSLYVPEGAMLPWYYETDSVDLTMIHRRYKDEISADNLEQYFISSMSGVRVFNSLFAGSLDFSRFSACMAAGLYCAADGIPCEAMVADLDYKALRSCVTELGFRPSRTKEENVAQLLSALENDPKGAGRVIRGCRDWSQYFGILPPEGLDWETFQGMRQQTKGMMITLRDFLGGWLLNDDQLAAACMEY